MQRYQKMLNKLGEFLDYCHKNGWEIDLTDSTQCKKYLSTNEEVFVIRFSFNRKFTQFELWSTGNISSPVYDFDNDGNWFDFCIKEINEIENNFKENLKNKK